MAGTPRSGEGDADADAGDARFLHDIEALSKALSLDSNSRRRTLPSAATSDSRSLSAGRSRRASDPKLDKPSSSFWRSLKALSHIGQRRFDCLFSLHVHAVEDLPDALEGAALAVHWRRTSDAAAVPAAATRPVQAFHGVVEFGETLTYLSSVYARVGSNRSAKYAPLRFTIDALAIGAPGLDLGRHLVDLTRLLPLSVDELEEDEKGIGKWSTNFLLSGTARGAKLNVSFGYSLVKGGGTGKPGGERKVSKIPNAMPGRKDLLQVRGQDQSPMVEDVKVLREGLPSSNSGVSMPLSEERGSENGKRDAGNDLGKSEADMKIEHGLLDQEGLPELRTCTLQEEEDIEESREPKHCTLSELIKQHSDSECEGTEFSVIEQGIEITSKNQEPTELGRVDDDVGQDQEVSLKPEEPVKGYELITSPMKVPEDQAMEDLESVFCNLFHESEECESPRIDDNISNHLSYANVKSTYRSGSMKSSSRSLDAMTESVASEFLSMLGLEYSPFGLSSDSEAESPRERLLKQFEKETLASGSDYFGLDSEGGAEESDTGDVADDLDLALMVHEAEKELQMREPFNGRYRAKLLADAETEALMHQWGFDEKAFQCSPPGNRSGSGSPIDLPPDELLELPPLCEGLGPFVQTKGGGFLRSMNPDLFRNAKNNGSLIMQASCPIVVPAEMGSGIMEILHRLASVGIEKLSIQANKLMPLEDITEKTLLQMAWDAAPALESYERHNIPDDLSERSYDSSCKRRKGRGLDLPLPSGGNMTSEYVSLEDLAPLAMEKIEALSIEGLRIQSGMSDEEAPSNVNAQSIGEISALEGKGANNSSSLGLEGTAGLQLLDVKDSEQEVDGLIGLSITLDEWMKLDSGVIDEENQTGDRASKILVAHHANSMGSIIKGSKGEKKGKKCGRQWGLLGNNFTVALMVQLRDPLRNYEPVGTPMLSLIQVERVFVPPKPRIYCVVSEKGNSEGGEEPEVEAKPSAKEEKNEEEETVPQFKITELHIAGLKSEPDKKKSWGSPVQQQSGSRWLLAAGMGKSNKHPLMKSKALAKSSLMTTTRQPGDTLWSISSHARGTGTKWKESAGFGSRIRNPNIIIPNKASRLD